MLVILFSSFSSFSQTFETRLDSLVHSYDSLGGFNGLIVTCFSPEDVRTFSYGYKDPRTKSEKITTKDPFDLASVAKQFTGIATLQLIEKGTLHEEDSIGKYLEWLKPALGKVTIRQLANHTNGIPDFYSLLKEEDISRENINALLAGLDSTVFEPGTKWGYSNSGYYLLSLIIEKVSGMTFTDYCHKSIFTPLGMESTCFAMEGKQALGRYSSQLELLDLKTCGTGEAGLYASGEDMIAYYQRVTKDSEKWKNYFSASQKLSDQANEPGWMYGFGWYFSKDSFGSFRAHGGKNGGANTYVRWYDESGLFICILCNKGNTFTKEMREKISLLAIEERRKK